MANIKFDKIAKLRVKMHLSTGYLAKLLGISEADYQKVEQGNFEINEKQLDMICRVFSVPKGYFYAEPNNSKAVLARAKDNLTANDEAQIAEFLNFQKFLGKKKNEELVVG
ncbi:helix-turn-helix domain-containing protein [Priestia megaterium]|uniref:helix-turn-helix domain-containing protein n=1 Tax=Priestia megaterium TaxID=1404 RepID=UPI003398BB6E